MHTSQLGNSKKHCNHNVKIDPKKKGKKKEKKDEMDESITIIIIIMQPVK
jgi:hypothetical protein